jgi:hypothetical protein
VAFEYRVKAKQYVEVNSGKASNRRPAQQGISKSIDDLHSAIKFEDTTQASAE